MDANILIQGLLGGLIFALAGWGISKIGGRSKKKAISELSINFSGENLSVKEKTAIIYLLMKVAECDGNINSKELTQLQAIMTVLDYNPRNKDVEPLAVEMEKYSENELTDILLDMDLPQKEWFAKSSIILAESDSPRTQQECNYISFIIKRLGIDENNC